MIVRPRRVLIAGAVIVGVLGLASCTDDALATAYGESSGVAYADSGIRVRELAPDERGDPVVFSGTTDTGAQISSADIAGVAVVDFWYAGCGPCRGEAEDLESVWQDAAGDGVAFVGVNTSDQADTSLAFRDTYGVTYPTILDADSGTTKLAFAADAPLQAPPVTIVLDAEHRVAARIIGPIEGTSVLSTLISDVLAEG